MNILIVDDDFDMAECLEIQLKRKGHGTKIANNMEQAVNFLICDLEFHALLLDLQGGDIDRVKIAEAARRKGIRVITMSGAHELKPNLEKPFNSNELDKALQFS